MLSPYAAAAGIGALAGTAATLAMSVVMLAAQRAGLMGRLPPRQITEATIDAVPKVEAPTEESINALSVGAHLGFGAAAGALFAVVYQMVRSARPAPLAGMIFGFAVWAVSYVGWIPALGIMPPPQRDRPGRPESMLVAHLVYGLVLGTLVGRFLRPPRTRSSRTVD